MPKKSYKLLVIPVKKGQTIPQNLQYEGQNMTAIHEILVFLEKKFTYEPVKNTKQKYLFYVISVDLFLLGY